MLVSMADQITRRRKTGLTLAAKSCSIPAHAALLLHLCRCRFGVRLPNPPQMKHKGNFVISLRWAGSWEKLSAGGQVRGCLSAYVPQPALD